MIEMITLRLMIHHNSLSMVFILLTISIIAHNIAYYHKSHHHPFPPSLIADQIITITKFLLSFGRMEVSVSCQSRPVQCWTEFEFAVFEPNLFCLLAAGSSEDEKVSYSRINTNLRGRNNCREIHLTKTRLQTLCFDCADQMYGVALDFFEGMLDCATRSIPNMIQGWVRCFCAP